VALRLFKATCRGAGRPDARGALFIAVCRGKLSEGIDFRDNLCRLCIVVGLPFPNIGAPEVVLKCAREEAVHGRGAGSRHLVASAMLSVNQAIGRAIRHRGDFGAVVLIDDRFNSGGTLHPELVRWIRPAWRGPVAEPAQTFAQLRSFFEAMAQRSGES
jgi:Rad3-related DNA helicase